MSRARQCTARCATPVVPDVGSAYISVRWDLGERTVGGFLTPTTSAVGTVSLAIIHARSPRPCVWTVHVQARTRECRSAVVGEQAHQVEHGLMPPARIGGLGAPRLYPTKPANAATYRAADRDLFDC